MRRARAARLGGRAVTDVLGDGFHLNLGPHALYRKGHAERVLAELGVPVEGGRPATEGRLLRDGVAHALPDWVSQRTRPTLRAALNARSNRLLHSAQDAFPMPTNSGL